MVLIATYWIVHLVYPNRQNVCSTVGRSDILV